MKSSDRIDPGFFLRSFLALIVHYVVIYVGLLLGILLITRLGFPELFELWTLPEGARERFHSAWENNPEMFFPFGLCCWLTGLGLVLGVLTGLSVAWWSPFSGAGHGIFLAIVCIVTFLQISLTQDQVPKGLIMALLVVVPTGIVAGSRLGEWLFGQYVNPGNNESGDDSPGENGGDDFPGENNSRE